MNKNGKYDIILNLSNKILREVVTETLAKTMRNKFKHCEYREDNEELALIETKFIYISDD